VGTITEYILRQIAMDSQYKQGSSLERHIQV